MSESDVDKLQPLNPPETEEAIAEMPAAAEAEASSAQIDEASFAKETASLELEGTKDELITARDLHATRKEYTSKLFRLIVVWLSIVVLFVFLSATLKPRFTLSDSVLIAFITSTTVSVLGLFVLVAKWLFPQGPDKRR